MEDQMLVACTTDGNVYRLPTLYTWERAQQLWAAYDGHRRAGQYPAVRWFAVRSAADPTYRNAPANTKLFDEPLYVLRAREAGGSRPAAEYQGQRPRPTTHQADTLRRLANFSRAAHTDNGWVADSYCGSPSALQHLYAKGYAETMVRRGPRNGAHRYYRPTAVGLAWLQKRQRRQAAA